MSSAERTIKQLQDDKSRYIRDINAARDLSLTIDRSKEELHKQLTTLSVEIEHANKNIQKLELDKEGLTEQLRAEVSFFHFSYALFIMMDLLILFLPAPENRTS